MNAKLHQIYLKPNSQWFRFLDYVARHRYFILFFCVVLSLSYPLFLVYQTKQAFKSLNHEQNEITQQIQHKQQQLNQLENQLFRQEDRLGEINQQIKTVLEQQQAQLENIYWNLAQQKSAELIFNQNAHRIFNTLYQLNQLPQIRLKSLTLAKLNQQQLIQCQLVFTVINREEK